MRQRARHQLGVVVEEQDELGAGQIDAQVAPATDAVIDLAAVESHLAAPGALRGHRGRHGGGGGLVDHKHLAGDLLGRQRVKRETQELGALAGHHHDRDPRLLRSAGLRAGGGLRGQGRLAQEFARMS